MTGSINSPGRLQDPTTEILWAAYWFMMSRVHQVSLILRDGCKKQTHMSLQDVYSFF